MVSLRAHLAGLAAAALTLAGPVSAEIGNVLDAQAGLKSWTADFVQTRTLKSLKQPLRTPGHLYFVAPNIFRWELGDPTQTIAVRTSNEVLLIYPPLKRAERYSVAANERNQWQEMLSLLDAGFPRSQRDLESRFKIVSDREDGGKTHLVLQPKAASARRWMQEMELVFDSAAKSLVATELRFADGSSLRNDFNNERKNAEIAPELFRPEIPPDYKVIEPAKRK
jgi:outer membrane lipoprotein carrier protein